MNLCWLATTFSDGDLKRRALRLNLLKPEECDAEETVFETAPMASTFSCPQDGYVFRRHTALQKHLSFEKCAKSVERAPLLDLAKLEYAARLAEGVGKIPVLPVVRVTSSTRAPLTEGWALKQIRKPYRFNEKQKSY